MLQLLGYISYDYVTTTLRLRYDYYVSYDVSQLLQKDYDDYLGYDNILIFFAALPTKKVFFGRIGGLISFSILLMSEINHL